MDFFFPTCSHDGKYLTSGSENQCVFLWRTQYESASGANIAARRKDRNNFYEAIKGDYYLYIIKRIFPEIIRKNLICTKTAPGLVNLAPAAATLVCLALPGSFLTILCKSY